jgi:hypothetical protein
MSKGEILTATTTVSESEIRDTNRSTNGNAVAEMIACRMRGRYKLRILDIPFAICASV